MYYSNLFTELLQQSNLKLFYFYLSRLNTNDFLFDFYDELDDDWFKLLWILFEDYFKGFIGDRNTLPLGDLSCKTREYYYDYNKFYYLGSFIGRLVYSLFDWAYVRDSFNIF